MKTKKKEREIDMAQNLFDNAKFGDMFLTTENKQAVFLRFAKNAEHKFAILYIEGWGNVQVFRHNGKEVHGDAVYSIIKKQQEPVSEELKVELEKYIKDHFTIDTEQLDRFGIEEKDYMYSMDKSDMLALVEHFTNWQKEQFEKNRLIHCDELTAEQAKFESDFVAQHLKKNSRTPTFIDAIEYGMKFQREDMMKDAKSGTGNYDNYIKFEDGTWIDLDPSEQLKPAFNVNEGDKVKVIVIKEE